MTEDQRLDVLKRLGLVLVLCILVWAIVSCSNENTKKAEQERQDRELQALLQRSHESYLHYQKTHSNTSSSNRSTGSNYSSRSGSYSPGGDPYEVEKYRSPDDFADDWEDDFDDWDEALDYWEDAQ